MRIKSIRIKNFRSFKDCTLNLNDYTSLVGANGAGKSTILCALNIFFREEEESSTNVTKLEIEDFHKCDTGKPIEITVTFHQLSDEAKEDFSAYFRQDQLIITARAEYKKELGVAEVQQLGVRKVMDEFKSYFEMDKSRSPVTELRAEYNKLRETYSELPTATSKSDMEAALRKFEEDNPDRCVELPSDDKFYGFVSAPNLLRKYVQWIYLPAVKNAKDESIEEKGTALGKILGRTVRTKVNFKDDFDILQEATSKKYKDILNKQKDSLNEISQSLTRRLAQWSHPGTKATLSWKDESEKCVKITDPEIQILAGERDFEGDLARFGHGLQRSYLLAVLEELASSDDKDAPTLIFGCEEPELFQHPPQARYIAKVFEELSKKNSQIIAPTHSPYFVYGKHFENLRIIRYSQSSNQSHIYGSSFSEISDRISEVKDSPDIGEDESMIKLQQLLQPGLSEMFFASKLVFVEGMEDEAYIMSALELSGRMGEYRQHDVHIVPALGKHSLVQPLVLAEKLEIPFYVVFDSDKRPDQVRQNGADITSNKAILRLSGGDDNVLFPDGVVWKERFVQWPINVGATFEEEIGTESWNDSLRSAGIDPQDNNQKKQIIRVAKHVKNLYDNNNVPESLTKLIDQIIRFASTN